MMLFVALHTLERMMPFWLQAVIGGFAPFSVLLVESLSAAGVKTPWMSNLARIRLGAVIAFIFVVGIRFVAIAHLG